MEKKITVPTVLSNGVALGLKNFVSLIGCVILYALTCWIPYINIGTTIAMAKLPLELAKGNAISPMSIFDKKHFEHLSNYFLIQGLIIAGSAAGAAIGFFPGIVIAYAWSLGILLMLDKGTGPLESLSLSYKLTMGYKWTMFFSEFIIGVALGILCLLFSFIPFVGILFILAVMLLVMPIRMGIQAYIYSQLAE